MTVTFHGDVVTEWKAPPVVFLVGGRGTRLGLGDKPKSLVDIDGRPLLERMVLGLAKQGAKKFIFMAGHGANFIEEHFGDGAQFGVEIDHIVEKTPLGTAGCFDLLRGKLNEPFVVAYGDVLFEIDLARFVDFGTEKGGFGTLYVHPNDHPIDSDLVDVDENDLVLRFLSKPHDAFEGGEPCGNLVNAAFYYFSDKIFNFVPLSPAGVIDWGRDVLPQVIDEGGALYAYRGTEYLKDIGTPDRIEKGENAFRSGRVARRSYQHEQRAIFLDRDGVINREVDGVFDPDLFELLPGTGAAIASINQSPFLAVCVTNQPALAKGFMSSADLKSVHARMDRDLAEHGGYLDDIFWCPHHPETGFDGEVAELKVACDCRKPSPGMLLSAARRHNIDLAASYMIGDHLRDINAGRAVGATCVFIGNRAALPDTLQDDVLVQDSLLSAINEIFEIERLAI